MSGSITLENFLEMWNEVSPEEPLTVADLKNPHSVVRSLLLLLKKVDVETEVVTMPPPEEERNDHVEYYSPLIPIINLKRILNHIIIKPINNCPVNLSCFLQPSTQTSFPILALLFNYVVFNSQQLEETESHERVILENNEQIKNLTDLKNELIQRLNNHEAEKANLVHKMQKMEEEIKKMEKEIQPEKAVCELKRVKLQETLDENSKEQKIFDQLSFQRDKLIADIEKNKMQRVTDADDILKQAAALAEEMAEAEKKCNVNSATLLEMENKMMNLQQMKQTFDVANECLENIEEIVDSLKDVENDFEADSEEGRLKVLQTELDEVLSQNAELKLAREEAQNRRIEATNRHQQAKAVAERLIQEETEKYKKRTESSKKEIQIVENMKNELVKFDTTESELYKKETEINESVEQQLKTLDEVCMEQMKKFGDKIKEKVMQAKK